MFSGVSFNLNEKSCVGLAGKNGSGKTTLLKIIAGEIKSDYGGVSYPKDMTIGYLPQEKEITGLKSIKEETLDAFKFINDIKLRIDELNVAVQDRKDYQSESYNKILLELDELTHKL